ncbi:hypothetical protein [Methylotuvimicrobium sp.]|jgi:hypothetical protein|uniref:hypothetical protein n=1 Tax=Methylotuvimicrobium sp. TaxID=2822413 RepID=UPI003D65FF9B
MLTFTVIRGKMSLFDLSLVNQIAKAESQKQKKSVIFSWPALFFLTSINSR